jgi:hypothetical protein
MQIVYARKPKIHMLQKGKAVCGRHWLDGEEEGSKFAGSVDCKDCLRLLTQRAADKCHYPNWQGGLEVSEHNFGKDGYCVICGTCR